jgi:transcriptional regulator with GAF, ATPase, and Fis domain
MMAVARLVVRVSSLGNLPVLLSGETGTGKELLAQAIHALDPKRCQGPFVPLNCAALPPELAEAELFGHRRGAFTGAEHERKGLFRAAEGGVIFLDEIAELRLELQAKLLRVLQENRLLVLGEDRETSVNVRLLAATNQNLCERVAQGAFRSDLFHRLNVIPIHVPPLRERPGDVEVLVLHFLQKYRELNPACSRLVAPEFLEGLQCTGLPGNVRQLENIVRQAIARKENDAPLGLADLPQDLWEELSTRATPPNATDKPKIGAESPATAPVTENPSFPLRLLEQYSWNLPRSVRHFERMLLELALNRTHGNQSETARLLGVTPRSIYNKLHQYPG